MSSPLGIGAHAPVATAVRAKRARGRRAVGQRGGWTPMQRMTLMVCSAITFVLSVCTEAPATTLKLVFADGQPMTYGSACSGEGCLQRDAGVEITDAAGEVALVDAPDRTVEYRRDGVAWWEAPLGAAAGRVWATGDRTTVVLPRMLLAGAPAVDAAESDVVARINAERAARALPLAALNTRLSMAADFQATWLTINAVGLVLPVLSHIGPFGSTLPFRLAEVSFPEPGGGAEVAAAGLTAADALSNWLASGPHADHLLAPGPLLIGVAKIGSLIVVTLHPPCAGCEQEPPVGSSAGVLGPGGPAAPGGSATPGMLGSPGTSALSGSGDRADSSCGDERLRVRRLRTRGGRLRLRVTVRCPRPGARYTLSVIQRPSRTLLTRRKMNATRAITLALRPARSTRTLRIKLKRSGRVVAAQTVNRRRAVPRRR